MTKGVLSKEAIIDAAIKIADEKGLSNVTLKELAAELGVKSPSLYKHIPGGLGELYENIMVYSWRSIDNEIMRSAVGRTKDDAIKAMCYAFRNFAVQHPGAFEILQWHNSYTSDLNKQATQGIIASLNQVLEAYQMTEEQKLHILRFLRGFVQGFSSIETHAGFGDAISVDDSFEFAIEIIIKGIHALQGETRQ